VKLLAAKTVAEVSMVTVYNKKRDLTSRYGNRERLCLIVIESFLSHRRSAG
jgi:hypothetical protein